MSAEITFVIPGETRGWQRAGREHLGGNKVRSFTPKKMVADQGVIRHFAAQAMRGKKLLRGAVRLDIAISKTHPKSWSKKKRAETWWITGKPDCSNRLKQIEDAMNKIVYDDDSQIANLHVTRFYGADNWVRVTVKELPAGTAP